MKNLNYTIDQILKRKVSFVLTFSLVFLFTYALLYALDIYPERPEPMKTTSPDSEQTATEFGAAATPGVVGESPASEPVESTTTEKPSVALTGVETTNARQVIENRLEALPVTITFNSLGRTVNVLNPTSRNVDDLDAALLKGAVRHPDSATFANEGTIFILGHSSYLPVVHNKNFQAFNDIQDLAWGDTIELSSETAVYTYRVDKVYQAKASELYVPIAGTGPKLVVSTCNSFASKDDRYMVEASLVNERSI